MKAISALYASVLSIPLAAGTSLAQSLTLRMQIDGISRLSLRRSEIYWDHIAHGRPGTFGGDYPTVVNGYEWFPIWPNTANGSPGLSASLTGVALEFRTNDTIVLEQLSGRGPVRILEQPSEANNFGRVHIEFDDGAPPGADWYTIVLHGVSFVLTGDLAFAQNLIVNGRFETPEVPLGQHAHIPPDALAPWRTTDDSFELWASGSFDGNQNLEILSHAATATVWQTVSTVPREDYTLSFYHTPRPGIQSTLTVSINTQLVATFNEDGSALTAFLWQKFTRNFTATSNSTTISFSDVAAAAAGTHIDKVALQRLAVHPAIRVSEVELCWQTVTNKTYQVQYRSGLTTNAWVNFGARRPGTGASDCLRDTAPSAEPQRFYRIITVP